LNAEQRDHNPDHHEPIDPTGDGHAGGELASGPDDPPIVASMLGEVEAAPESEGVIRSGNLAGRTMWAAIWILALPILVQQTMAACVGLVDKIVAGSLPVHIVRPAMDGISVGSYVGWFVSIAMAGLGIGGQALIARAMGAGDRAQSQRALAQAISASVAWGIFIGVLMWFGAGPLATMAQLSPEASMHCRQYVQTLALFMPFIAIMMVGSMCLHGAGETLKPSIIAAVVNVLNIGFTWALSGVELRFGQPGEEFTIPNPMPIDPAQWGVIGIAAGSGVAYVFGAAFTLWLLLRGVRDLRLEGREMPFDGRMIWRFMRIGVPNFLEGIAMWAVNLFVLRFIGQVAAMRAAEAAANGEERAVAEGLHGAHLIAVQWEAFSFLPGFAIGTAAGALAGQYLGAANPRMAQKAVMACTGFAALFMGVLGVVFIFGGTFLTSIISTDPVHLEETPRLLLICGLVQVFFAVTMVVRQALRGVGDTTWVLIITTVSSYGVRLPAAWLFGVHLGYGLAGIWIGLCGEIVVRALLFTARFAHGGWKRIRV
jgi:putative MATE family efflux protein